MGILKNLLGGLLRNLNGTSVNKIEQTSEIIARGPRKEKALIDKMTEGMGEILGELGDKILESDEDIENALEIIVEYLCRYNRIIYSPMSNEIYGSFNDNNDNDSDKAYNIVHNLEVLINYTEKDDFTRFLTEKQQNPDDVRRTLIKMWDHISLAIHQYTMLKQSDDEYQSKFKESMEPFKHELTKDMSAQLLTLVGIFTALSFLIFGGISSLSSIFSKMTLPLFKVLAIGSVWGLCIINMIFVFLYCVGKMTKMTFSSYENKELSIFKRYPIVWSSNFLLLLFLGICMWLHYITQGEMYSMIDTFLREKPWIPIWGGFCLILIFAIVGGTILFLAVEHIEAKERRKEKKQAKKDKKK